MLFRSEAHRLGMVARLAPAGEHERVARDLAATLAGRPAVSVSLAKQALDQGLDSTLDTAMAREVDHAILTSISGEGAAPREAFNRD